MHGYEPEINILKNGNAFLFFFSFFLSLRESAAMLLLPCRKRKKYVARRDTEIETELWREPLIHLILEMLPIQSHWPFPTPGAAGWFSVDGYRVPSSFLFLEKSSCRTV